MGLVRDLNSPLGTRFELRAPNPHSNTYLVMATLYLAMLDGVTYAITNNKSQDDLLKELSKQPGDEADYLEKDRAYRSEEDVFEYFNDEERARYYGTAPATIFENLSAFDKYPEKLKALQSGNVLSDKIINSYRMGTEERWLTEINTRIISNYSDEIRSFKKIHNVENALDLDVSYWQRIQELRVYLLKDSYTTKSLFTNIKEAIDTNNLQEVSNLQVEMDTKMKELRDLYIIYSKNLLY